ncbi:MAG: TolB family protein [Bacteriovoracaceae bacterium]
MIKFKITLLVLLFPVIAAANYAIVGVGEAELERDKIVFQKTSLPKDLTPIENSRIKKFIDTFKDDFSFYVDKFDVLDEKLFIQSEIKNNSDYIYWINKKVNILFSLRFWINKTNVHFGLSVYKVSLNQKIYETNGVIQQGKRLTSQVHKLADLSFRKITGGPSIFNSKIVFVSDRDTPAGNKIKDNIKELYVMDFNGENKKRLTYHRGLVISPSISHDGTKILYSLIKGGKGRKNVDLYLFDLNKNSARLISRKKGLNSGAIFSRDDNVIYLTLSHVGNAEIYSMSLDKRRLRRITRHYASDVDPSITDDGSKMVFLSNRAGKAMIYTMDPRATEKDVRRISYVGDYNATPRFSPDGQEIVFSSWLDKRFDLFKINPDGTGLSRLTKNFGSNEDPVYSNDGEFIAFANLMVESMYKKKQAIYLMTREGKVIKNLTQGFGNCQGPRWSRF